LTGQSAVASEQLVGVSNSRSRVAARRRHQFSLKYKKKAGSREGAGLFVVFEPSASQNRGSRHQRVTARPSLSRRGELRSGNG